jgi:hypothetical protein
LLGGTFKSSKPVATSRYSSFRNALFQIAGGNRFDFPVSYSSIVCLSIGLFNPKIDIEEGKPQKLLSPGGRGLRGGG